MRSTQVTARLPATMVSQIDQMAEALVWVGGQVLRLLLSRATEEGLPAGLTDHVEALKAARGQTK